MFNEFSQGGAGDFPLRIKTQMGKYDLSTFHILAWYFGQN